MKYFTSIFHETTIVIPVSSRTTYEMYGDKRYLEDIYKSAYKLRKNDNGKMVKYLESMSKEIDRLIHKAKSKKEISIDNKYDENILMRAGKAGVSAARASLFDINADTVMWDKNDWDKAIKNLESCKKFTEAEIKKYKKGIKESFLSEIELI